VVQDLRVIVVDEMDALLDAYPASFGQLMDAAVHRHTPSNSSSSDGPAAAAAAASLGAGGSDDSAQDNLSKLKALLDRQQQQEQEKQQRAAGDAAAAGSVSLAAAAARLEGLLSVPAAAGADEQQQQEQLEGSSAGEQDGAERQQQQQVEQLLQQQQELQRLQAEAAALEDDTPMPKPQVVLVGATVSDDDITLALNRGWVEEPVLVLVGTAGNVPAGLKHKAVVVAASEKRLGGLVISLRKDLSDALAAADAAAAAADHVEQQHQQQGEQQQPQQQQHAAPVRVIVFAPSEVEARGAAEPLRAALWGDHMLSVLLPSTGAEPIKALHAFRDRVASLLLATPSAARGLDLPAVSHVYSLGLPPDATEYVHRAGRAGRIGSTAGGEVCTVVTREELPALQQMVEQELGLELECVELDRQGLGLLGSEYDAARQELLQQDEEVQQQQQKQGEAGMGEKQLENARKGLEDLFNLL
jgi:hypothetical protein